MATTDADLVGGVEAAGILGVSRQRFYELQRVHGDFPQPALRLSRGQLWRRLDLERWAARWERRPGRPQKQETPPGP